MASTVTNCVIAGLGGQGVLTASDILADAAFRTGVDVKKSEVHGMSQRGGSVFSDVRFGSEVLSPMVVPGEADYLVVAAPDQIEPNRHRLGPAGILISADMIDPATLPHKRSMNVALLGMLSAHLDIPAAAWEAAIKARLAPKLHEINIAAFQLGRQAAG